MLNIIIAVILTSAIFILFFEPRLNLKNKKERVEEPSSTTDGFIEDTYRGPFVDQFIPPKYGDIGTFVGFSSVPEDHWLHGFPHEEA